MRETEFFWNKDSEDFWKPAGWKRVGVQGVKKR